MPQLPTPATTGDVWGNQLNTFLTTALDNTATDGGKVKPTAIKSATTDSGKVLAVDNTGTSNWINAQDVIVNTTIQQLLTPAGAVPPFYMTTAPSGWLICDGSNINTADYPILSAILQQKNLYFFAVNQSNSVLTTVTNHNFNTGDTVKMDVQAGSTASPALPAGFNNTTTYYVKKLSNNTLSLHFSAADATAGTNQFSVTNTGSGTFYIFSATGFSATVALPDLRGEFIRGLDLGRAGIPDTNRALGSFQNFNVQSHAHGVNDPGHAHGISTTGFGQSVATNDRSYGNYGAGSGNGLGPLGPRGNQLFSIDGAGTGVSIQAAGGPETRPRNIGLLYCIKY